MDFYLAVLLASALASLAGPPKKVIITHIIHAAATPSAVIAFAYIAKLASAEASNTAR